MKIYAGFTPKERGREGGRERGKEGGRVVEEGGRQSHGSNHFRGQLNYWHIALVTTWATSTHVHFLSRACTHTTLHPHYHTLSPLSLTIQHSSCTPLSPSHTMSHALSSILSLYLAATMIFTLFTVQSHKTWTSLHLMWRVLSRAWMSVGNTRVDCVLLDLWL